LAVLVLRAFDIHSCNSVACRRGSHWYDRQGRFCLKPDLGWWQLCFDFAVPLDLSRSTSSVKPTKWMYMRGRMLGEERQRHTILVHQVHLEMRGRFLLCHNESASQLINRDQQTRSRPYTDGWYPAILLGGVNPSTTRLPERTFVKVPSLMDGGSDVKYPANTFFLIEARICLTLKQYPHSNIAE